MRVKAFAVLAVFSVGGGLVAQRPAAKPEQTLRPVLVELFTSEGCSSCPPADELLRKLAGKRTDSGQLIVALSEHVTYWNYLGWTDPFSSEAFTQRQEIYGERFNLDGVYTPQAVVNSDRQMPGGEAGSIVQAVQAQKVSAGNSLRIASAVVTHGDVIVTFSVTGPLSKSPASLYAAIADDMDTSKVARGENGGRTLTHVAVARNLLRVGDYKIGDAMTVTLPVATQKNDAGGGRQHVVLFAQEEGQGPISSVAAAVVEAHFPQRATEADVH
jgi:hypothetical protein